ncbi:hypothetical protein [Flexibacterium corallicola]|uniref:hypothetical protein n=1 Tax=Flexibacterium corallicola TaxID=3037259 RepID=UPI00286EFC9B|nr:hypothetical protein [Pseudovibrio sp. M1P-2-3]
MEKRELDPWREEYKETLEPFAVGFKKKAGEPLVYGSFLMGAVAFGLFLVTRELGFALASVPAFMLSYWYYPMIANWPQIGANSEGLFLERLGFIEWSSIESVEFYKTSVRSMVFKCLRVRLHSSLESCAVKKEVFPFWRRFMFRNWKRVPLEGQREMILVPLHVLNADAEQVYRQTKGFVPIHQNVREV